MEKISTYTPGKIVADPCTGRVHPWNRPRCVVEVAQPKPGIPLYRLAHYASLGARQPNAAAAYRNLTVRLHGGYSGDLKWALRMCKLEREHRIARRRYAPKYLARLPFDEHVARESRVRAGLYITRDGDTLVAPRAEPGWVEVGVAA
jgi:hypothetical protein